MCSGTATGHGRKVGPDPLAWLVSDTILIWYYSLYMKKTLHIDERLLQEAKAAVGARTDTETVRLGLEALVRRGAYERLRRLRGSEPKAHDVPRRRGRTSSAKNSAA